MKISIREVKHEDLDDILEIENASFSVPWSRKAFESELLNNMALYICLECDDKVVAYVGIWKIYDEGHITNVAVLPNYRGLGLSKLLLNYLFDVCNKNDIFRLTLEVRESNAVAIKLYEQLGFINTGKRPKYYSNPIEDAIIMWKEL
ncbi:MAG TPA: ribosomal-protein-alanine N-acetyltransferase [Clostridiales bacterium]|nr:ribosomal-protein-alanine N-acetyltransferase [Clostridiales bacterium]